VARDGIYLRSVYFRDLRIDLQASGTPPGAESMWIMAVYVLIVVVNELIVVKNWIGFGSHRRSRAFVSVLDVILRGSLVWLAVCGSSDRSWTQQRIKFVPEN